jgi:hypothetical protein
MHILLAGILIELLFICQNFYVFQIYLTTIYQLRNLYNDEYKNDCGCWIMNEETRSWSAEDIYLGERGTSRLSNKI